MEFRPRPGRRLIPALALLVAFVTLPLAGCTTFISSVRRGHNAYHIGNFGVAHKELSKVAKGFSPKAPAAKLDLAMVELVSGDSEVAINRLRDMRDEFDKLDLAAPIGNIASIVADDNARKFRPSGYEQVMIRSMLALGSLATGNGDADAYALQAQMKQQELAEGAEKRGLAVAKDVYQPLALAPYLRGVLRESTMHDYDDAIRAYQQVSFLRPDFAPATLDIQRCTSGVHSPPNHGALYIIAMVGRGPLLEETDAEATTAAMQIATQAYSIADRERFALPNLVSIKVPKVVVPFSPASAVSIDSSGAWLGATQPLVNVGEMARRQCEAEMPWTLARAIARRLTKEIAISQGTKAVGLDSMGREVTRFALVNVVSLGEHADTRCWGLLPREIQVLRAELPVGKHKVGMTVVDSIGHPAGAKAFADVEIQNGQNTYLTVVASDRQAFVAH